ncbi:hypothetical protein [Haloimpatiens massiliensis]|uniref:hypothetical protein n=1 Tax=Haloimpatiens massiliensis TaxID=1658110 RepID=UPI000C865C48|nr:hypothetical protein [Haloimpatiens massiliensis]
MYCVIQEIENKRFNEFGAYKQLEVDCMSFCIDGQARTKYLYKYTGERFKRPIRKAYKISIHKSYRKDGKVKKKQWVICTIGYYNIIDYGTWIGDYTIGLNNKLQDIGITEEKLCELVYKKLDPIIEKVKIEFQKTEEYKTHKKHREIIDKYLKAKNEFESLYGSDTYDYCYDIFGVLRNEEYLKDLKATYEAQKTYRDNYSSYHSNDYSNYDFSGYFKTNTSNYTKEEKTYLKTIYKAAAMKLHPDIKKDNGEGMKFLNKLKEEWGI